MTNPTGDELPMMLMQPGRARDIAAIHALANFYAQHPHVPMPKTLLAVTILVDRSEPDNIRDVLDFAHAHDGEVVEQPRYLKAVVPLVKTPPGGGLSIDVQLSTTISTTDRLREALALRGGFRDDQ